MIRRLKHLDKILLGVALALFLGAASLSPIGFRQLEAISGRNPVMAVDPAPYASSQAVVPTIGRLAWPDVAPQSRGKDWVYDVFTPPVIYYNRETGEFTVTPPVVVGPAEPTDVPFDVELLAVRQEPYRVQLIGYAGDEGAYIATFDLLETAETAIGRVGKEFAQAGFTLRKFEVRRETVTSIESMPVVDTVAVAVIFDERTGREETLTNRERKMMPRLQAVLRLRTVPVQERVVREGGTVDVNGQRYLIAQLSLDPPRAVISRRAPDALGAGETRTLVPVTAAPPFSQSRDGAILSFPSR